LAANRRSPTAPYLNTPDNIPVGKSSAALGAVILVLTADNGHLVAFGSKVEGNLTYDLRDRGKIRKEILMDESDFH
jgi:hypothetical protein